MDYNWVIKYLSLPWKAHSYGPNDFDCWGFMWYLHKHEKGITIPRFQYVDPYARKAIIETFRDNVEETLWRKLDKPRDFSVVLLGRAKFPTHCGIFLNTDGGVILHCSEAAGVNAVSLHNLHNQFQLKIFGYYMHKELL